MKLKKPENENYAAIMVEIKNVYPLEGCDNVQGTRIFGNQVIVSNDVKVGDKGLYFPLETQLTKEYLSNNNLYRNQELNIDPEKKGYFDENGRIRCQKFRGFDSQGLFMPIESLEFLSVKSGDIDIDEKFDTIDTTVICRKYEVKPQRQPGIGNGTKSKKEPKLKEYLVDNQFRFHSETSMLYSNVHKIQPNTLLSVSYKAHGSSGIVSNVLVKRKLNIISKLLNKLGAKIPTEEYGFIYSSGKPKSKLPKGIVGSYKNDGESYYTSDIWKQTYEMLKDYVSHGMTIYYEIVGFSEGGQAIQKGYDYGCQPKELKIFVYRVTYTNDQGKVFEFSARQVQEWCKNNGLVPVHEMFYGYAIDLAEKLNKKHKLVKSIKPEEHFGENLLELIKLEYNEKDCFMCKNKTPEEGVVVRIEGIGFEAYKQKSKKFYEHETKQLDKGETGMEE